MIQKKICMLGAFAVGKTSLVSRYVRSIFSEKYLTTVGVKIDKKIVTQGDQDVTLLLWDLAGEDEFVQVRMSYVRGSAGYILVADGTRRETLDTAISLQKNVEDTVGSVPFVLAVNKMDLSQEWELNDASFSPLIAAGWTVKYTSARSGFGVEDLFSLLTAKMLEG